MFGDYDYLLCDLFDLNAKFVLIYTVVVVLNEWKKYQI